MFEYEQNICIELFLSVTVKIVTKPCPAVNGGEAAGKYFSPQPKLSLQSWEL